MLIYLWTLSLAFAEPPSALSISLDTEIENQLLQNLQGLDDAEKITVMYKILKRPCLRVHVYTTSWVYNIISRATFRRLNSSTGRRYPLTIHMYLRCMTLRRFCFYEEIPKRPAKLHLLAVQQQQGQHWVVSYRLAQIAASEQDTAVMEVNLKRALREGMPSQVLLDDKVHWQTHLANRTVALSMELLLSALGYESIWNGMKPTTK